MDKKVHIAIDPEMANAVPQTLGLADFKDESKLTKKSRVRTRWRELANKISLDREINAVFMRSTDENSDGEYWNHSTGGDYVYFPKEWSCNDPSELGWSIKVSEIEALADDVIGYKVDKLSIIDAEIATPIETFFQCLAEPEAEDSDEMDKVEGGDGSIMVPSEAQRLMGLTFWPIEWRRCDPAELGWWIKAQHAVEVHDAEKKCSIVGAIQTPTLLSDDKTAASAHFIGSKAITKCPVIGTQESNVFEVVTPACRRWRRKRKTFEEKAKEFLQGRMPILAFNYYQVLDGLNSDEEDFTFLLPSKKWQKKKKLFQAKALEHLDDDSTILSNSFAVF